MRSRDMIKRVKTKVFHEFLYCDTCQYLLEFDGNASPAGAGVTLFSHRCRNGHVQRERYVYPRIAYEYEKPSERTVK